MPEIPFATRAYERKKGGLPPFRLVNMLAEQAASAGSGIALIGREALAVTDTWGTGPIHGRFQQDGVFDGDRFAISGNTLYREGVSLGTIDGYGPVWWACSPVELVVGRGQSAYSYDGVDLEAIAFPDGAAVLWGVYIATLFVFARGGDAPQNNRFYWSDVLDARTVDDLNFASAEFRPDALLQLLVIGDNLCMLGGDSIEFWLVTGELALPFSRISQRLIPKGISGTGAAAAHDNSAIFVSNEKRVHRIGDVAERISDHHIEERIAASATALLFVFSYQGKDLAAVRLDQGTWLYDPEMKEWAEFQTLGRANWRAKCACMVDGLPQFGDDATGALLGFDGYNEGDYGLERVCTAYFPTLSSVCVDSIEIEFNPGDTSDLSGEGDNPVVEMRSSRDGGRNFTPWRGVSAGEQGQYRTRARWRRCGYFNSPGGLFEFRQTDPSSFRVSRVLVNEPAGGRGR